MPFEFIIQFFAAIFFAGVILFFLLRPKSKREPFEPKGNSWRSYEIEVEHIDYLLKALQEAKDKEEIDQKAYDLLKEKYVKRQKRLLGLIRERKVEVEVGAPKPVTPVYSGEKPLFPPPPTPKFIDEKSYLGRPGAEKVKPREPLTLAQMTRWLLYIGVFLVFIATIIFAVYKWQSFPEAVKFLILLFVTVSFYASGWYIRSKLQIELGGLALVVVGVVMTFFDGFIYLNAKNLLEDELAWSLVFLACSLIYLVVAFFVQHQLLIYLSGGAQVLSILSISTYYLSVSESNVQTEITILSSFIGLAVLGIAWLMLEILLKHIESVKELFQTPLFYLTNTLVGLVAVSYLIFFTYYFFTWKMAVLPFILNVVFNIVLVFFFTFSFWYRHEEVFLYPTFLAQVFTYLSCFFYFKLPKDYFALTLVLLSTLWLAAVWILKIKNLAKFFQKPLAYSSYVLSGLVSVIFSVNIIQTYFDNLFFAFGKSIVTVPNTLTFFSFATFFVLMAFYEKEKFPLYPALFFFTGFYILFLKKLGVTNDYLALSLITLTTILLIFAWLIRNKKYVEFLVEPLSYYSYLLSGVVALIFTLSLISKGDVGLATTNLNLLTVFLVSTFFVLATFFERKDFIFFISLLFLALLYFLLLMRFDVEVEFLALSFSLLGIIWLLAVWLLGKSDTMTLIRQPVLHSSYILVALTSMFYLPYFAAGKYIEAQALDTTANILTFLLLSVFYCLATFQKRESYLLIYPSLLFFTGFIQLTFLKLGVEFRYLAIPTAFLGFVYLVSSLELKRRKIVEIGKCVLNAAYVISVYSILLAFVHQPSLITVLLINACLYLVMSLVLDYEKLHIWAGLLQVAVALLVALDYFEVSHLSANVSYVSLYLASFAISLALREIEIKKLKSIGDEFFNFAAAFCLIQLALQVFGAISLEFLPHWVFDPITGLDILMFAFIVAGFFYITASQLYTFEFLNYLGYWMFLAAYITKLIDLDVQFVEWYSVPIGIYIIANGYFYQLRHPENEVLNLSNLTGLLIVCGSSTLGFMFTYDVPASQLHAVFAAISATVFLVAGFFGRIKLFFFGGILFLGWNALYQSWDYIYALPKWVTIGTLGVVLLISGIYLERRRKQFLDFLRNTKKVLMEEWN
jgi:hypothetical protein